MEKKRFYTKMISLLLAAGIVLLLPGCDNSAGNTPSGEPFIAETDTSAINNEATLGLTGTATVSSKPGVAVAAIQGGRIAITSVSGGTATITVSDNNGNEATIAVTVASGGSITIGTITKYSKPAFSTPANVTVTTGNANLTISWDRVPEATGYRIYIGTGNNPPSDAKDIINSGETTTRVVTGLINGTTYNVWVRAYKGTEASDYSSVKSGKPQVPETRPGKPEKPTLEAMANGQVQITWKAVADAETYEVKLTRENDVAAAAVDSKDGLTVLTWTTTQLVADTMYYVWIRARNAAGPGDYSDYEQYKTPGGADAPDAIAGTTWADATGNDKLSFKADGTCVNEFAGGPDTYYYTYNKPTLRLFNDPNQTDLAWAVTIIGNSFTVDAWNLRYTRQ